MEKHTKTIPAPPGRRELTATEIAWSESPSSLSERLIGAETPEQVDEVALEHFFASLGAVHASLFMAKGRGGDLVRVLSRGREEPSPEGEEPEHAPANLVALARASGQPVYRECNAGRPYLQLALPVVGEHLTELVILIQSPLCVGPSIPSRTTLDRMARSIGTARLEAQKRQVLGRGAEEAAQLAQMARLLSSTLDPKEIRERAIEGVTRLIRAETGSLLLLDQERGDLYFDVALGEGGERLKTIRLRLGEGLAGWCALHERPLIVNDVTSDSRWQAAADRMSRFVTRSVICAPLRSHGSLRGVLQGVNSLATDGFTEHDLDLLLSLADQVAVAVENAQLYTQLRHTFLEVAHALAESIEKRDPYTGGHTGRVAAYSELIGRKLGLAPADLEHLRLAAVLHDIGKIGIDDSVLRKPGQLSPEETAAMRQHPILGRDIVAHISTMSSVLPGILHHHEALDGSGYPDALAGEQIPLMARIIAVADAFDALTTDRPYRKAMAPEDALALMQNEMGKKYDRAALAIMSVAYRARELDDLL